MFFCLIMYSKQAVSAENCWILVTFKMSDLALVCCCLVLLVEFPVDEVAVI